MTSKRKHAARSRFSNRWNQIAARGLRGSWPYVLRRVRLTKHVPQHEEENEQTTEPAGEEEEV